MITQEDRSVTKKNRPAAVVIGVALILMALLQLLPFYVTLTTALKDRTDLSSQWILPFNNLFFENFATAIESGNILQSIGNSALITLVSTALTCLIGALAAYPLARRRTAFNKTVMFLIVGLIMIPPLSILVPLYTLLSDLGALNTYWGAILVMIASHLPLSVFLYAAFMRTIPVSLEEAATIDGAGILQVFFRVVFPLLKPVTATVAILTGVGIWNEYALSVFILREPEMQTIAPSIAAFFSAQSNNFGAAAAASLMAVLPVLVAYLFLQKWFMKGMVAGSDR
ncbi:carbohydrate ABC transporter permease [Arthrobacter tecti]